MIFVVAIVTVALGANLNFEAVKELDVTIEAFDRSGGTDSLSSTAILTIFVEDENDVAPSFDQSAYSMHVKENSASGTVIATVTATDPDTGLGGMVNYFITGANPLVAFEDFEISQTNGEGMTPDMKNCFNTLFFPSSAFQVQLF